MRPSRVVVAWEAQPQTPSSSVRPMVRLPRLRRERPINASTPAAGPEPEAEKPKPGPGESKPQPPEKPEAAKPKDDKPKDEKAKDEKAKPEAAKAEKPATDDKPKAEPAKDAKAKAPATKAEEPAAKAGETKTADADHRRRNLIGVGAAGVVILLGVL